MNIGFDGLRLLAPIVLFVPGLIAGLRLTGRPKPQKPRPWSLKKAEAPDGLKLPWSWIAPDHPC